LAQDNNDKTSSRHDVITESSHDTQAKVVSHPPALRFLIIRDAPF